MSGRPAAPPSRPDLRATLRRPGDALPGASIGTVPILWNNVDVEALRLGTDADTILDAIARVGYEGTQLGLGFPEGAGLQEALGHRGLRLAEVYAAFPATPAGPTEDALAGALERLRLLVAGDGDVLCVALDGDPDRDAAAGRVATPGTPILTDAGWARLAEVLHELGRATQVAGRRMAFHPHAGTLVEAPAEVERLMAETDPALVPLCLDVGHYLVGGGDPIEALERYGERVTHVHLKDVDPDVEARLRAGEIQGFGAAVAERMFTELGAGRLDLDGVIGCLVRRDYAGWLMVEQDSTWGPPAESAAIGRRVLASALRRAGAQQAGA
ncbi:MAG TPA: sugar phosphate isomerase/epimerase [Candidatus Saccharimonadales bacterium]|nr:sugar phosphate isomerase/epimerase [Candidatus Saccharimonadales bacterium]